METKVEMCVFYEPDEYNKNSLKNIYLALNSQLL